MTKLVIFVKLFYQISENIFGNCCYSTNETRGNDLRIQNMCLGLHLFIAGAEKRSENQFCILKKIVFCLISAHA
jgi:hypothetical protein